MMCIAVLALFCSRIAALFISYKARMKAIQADNIHDACQHQFETGGQV